MKAEPLRRGANPIRGFVRCAFASILALGSCNGSPVSERGGEDPQLTEQIRAISFDRDLPGDTFFRQCAISVSGWKPQDAARAALSKGDANFIKLDSNESTSSYAPGLSSCSTDDQPVPKIQLKIQKFRSELQAHPELHALCSIAINNFIISYNQYIARANPVSLTRSCDVTPGKIDHFQNPTDIGEFIKKDIANSLKRKGK